MASREPAVVDVREEIRAGREPFQLIMSAVEALQPGQPLELINSFEPVPLYTVMDRRGYDHETELTPDGDWKVLFTPREAGA